ncbi:SMP-30/gluconolactonase/LRE family protein [Tsuneonella sp. HG222]
MRRNILAAGIAGIALALAVPAAAQSGPAPAAGVKVAAIPGVVKKGAKWKTFWEGPMIVDGMAAQKDGSILFAQEQSNSIYKVWPDGRSWVEYPFVAGAGSVSIAPDGSMFAADRSCTDPGLGLGDKCTVPSKIVQLGAVRKTVADKLADGKTLGRINDLAADGHGGAYYTQGGLFRARADGKVDTIVAAGNPQQGGVFTNGLVLSPDRRTLYVTNRTEILAFAVAPDGSVGGQRSFATIAGEPEGSFGGDGLAVDASGRLYVTAGQGIVVFDPSGRQLGAIPVPRRAITVAIGGADGRTLYAGTLGANTPEGKNWATPQGVRNIAATIYSIRLDAKGVGR